MRNRLLVILLAFTANTGAAQAGLTLPNAPQLRWELSGDTNATFTLTNRDSKPLPATGWAIYFSALHSADSGTVGAGFKIEDVLGDLHRLKPDQGFTGLAPGASVKIPYVVDGRVLNKSFVPLGPYIVFDSAPSAPMPLANYVAAPFERASRVVTPQAQFTRDSAVRDIPLNDLPPILPTPALLTPGTGEVRFTAMPQISAPKELEAEASAAAAYLRPYFQAARGSGGPAFSLAVGPVAGQTSQEAYSLTVDPTAGVHIVGVTAAGVFYGLQSLRSLLPAPTGNGLTLRAIQVVDAPRFGYRGFMLDVARNFQPKSSVLRTIDLMARYKLNVLHLHLTDDEGWRIEIAGLPELTRIGARRGHSLDSKQWLQPSWGSGGQVDRPFGSGYFSRADYVEIVRYAKARHIEVIPEIEMPGHARAAVKSMAGNPQYYLTDPADTSKYRSVQGYPDNVMDPSLETTYAFIDKVVSELVAMHRDAGAPLRNIHMGGDEVPNGVWTGSPPAQALIKANGLSGVDDLWFVFYGRVAEILQNYALTPSGWEEIAVRKTRLNGRPATIPNPQFAGRGWRAYVWNNVPGWGAEDLAYRLANGGYDVVLSPVTNYYFDLAWNPNPDERGLDWGGFIDLRKPFEFIPFDYYRNARTDRAGNPLDPAVFNGKDRLSEYGRQHIVGLQGNLWSETLGGEGRLEYMLVPKIFGLAERAWASDPDWATTPDSAQADSLFRTAWSRFVNTVGKRELPRLDREMAGINYRIPTPGLKSAGGLVYTSIEVPGFTLRYTTDGNEPTVRSTAVNGPISARGTVRVAAFNASGRRGNTARITVP